MIQQTINMFAPIVEIFYELANSNQKLCDFAQAMPKPGFGSRLMVAVAQLFRLFICVAPLEPQVIHCDLAVVHHEQYVAHGVDVHERVLVYHDQVSFKTRANRACAL